MARTRTTVGIGLSALASFGVAAYMSGRRAVPSWSGTVSLDGLDGPVEVLRDKWAVPAVFASTSADAYRVQGWLHASDRTFQIDLMRRVGLGRLSELVGDKGIGSDTLMRTLGCPGFVEQEWEQLGADSRAALTAYAEGVNAAFDRARRRPPVEYRLLGTRPERWEPQHCLALARVLALGLCGNWESELARGELASVFGTDVLDALEAGEHEKIWPAQIHADVLGDLVAAAKDSAGFGGPAGIGSNNWVIGPRRTRSGGALLANDPHLDLQIPSVWYEQRLCGGDLDVRGFTFPGVPGIVLGHNGRIAWGFTNSSIDVQDVYLEELDETGMRYRDVGGDWRDLEIRTETIHVKGAADVVHEVRCTRRGPIITDVATTNSRLVDPLSLRWDSLRPAKTAETIWQLNRATNWDEFRDACRGWLAPAQNVVYADESGNIGFQHMGEIPVRANGNDGSVPRRGDDPAGEWVSTVPWEEQPHAFNPSSSRIVTANDRLVGDDYPYFMSREWMNGYRGERIRTLIDGIEHHVVGDQVRIQTDVYSIPGARMRDLLARLRPEPTTPAGQQVLRGLLDWDGELRAADDQSAAWRLLLRATQDEAFGFLGELLPRFLGFSRTGVNGFWSLFGRSTPRLLDSIDSDDRSLLEAGADIVRRRTDGDATLPEPLDGWAPHSDWRALLAAALDRAGAWWDGSSDDLDRADSRSLQRTRPGIATRTASSLGEKVEQRLLRRMRYHRLKLQHPLGMVPGLARVANRGPFAVPGDPDTVWQTSQFNNPTNEYALVGPSHRHVVDMSDVDRSVAVLCGGQSGHPASPHYADQVPMWRRGEARPAPFTRPAIEKLVRYRQQFIP